MADQAFDYVAVEASGRRVRGRLLAASDGAAFECLKRDGLVPVRLRPAKTPAIQGDGATNGKTAALADRDAVDLLSDLAALLQAGADIRASLAILSARSNRPAVRNVCRALSAEIVGGGAVDQAFARHFAQKRGFIAALVAAGATVGDLASGFQRAADLLTRRLKVRDQMITAISYPTFVFVSTLAAIGVILLFVVPSLSPLADQSAGGRTPTALAALLAASAFLRQYGLLAAILTAFAAAVLAVANRLGMLSKPLDRLMLDGPTRKISGGLVFGAFSISLGGMLAAGAPMSDALRLAVRTVGPAVARERLEPAVHAVRQGQPLSTALESVKAFPATIVRLAAVGEATGALGAMLARAGGLEEEAAVRRIEAFGRILSPALIVLMGGVVGLLMAALLSGVTEVGQSVLQ